MKSKLFFVSFLISLPFWWGMNVLIKNLENIFFWQIISQNPRILTAQLSHQRFQNYLEDLKPFKKWDAEDLEIKAESAISVEIDEKGRKKVLFEKNSEKKLPIASLTKLMTAFIVLENYDLSLGVEISKEAVEQENEAGHLKVGEFFTVRNLLYPLLMESSNDAAYALAEIIGQKAFIDLMNLEAKNLALNNTYFSNPTGLDPNNSQEQINYSTVKDLVKLTSHLIKEHPFIWEILSLPELDFYTEDGVFHHKIINTNELLKEFPAIIVGGKTGETPKAKGCLILVTKSPTNKGYLINIVLGSDDRFGEIKKIINWIYSAYEW